MKTLSVLPISNGPCLGFVLSICGLVLAGTAQAEPNLRILSVAVNSQLVMDGQSITIPEGSAATIQFKVRNAGFSGTAGANTLRVYRGSSSSSTTNPRDLPVPSTASGNTRTISYGSWTVTSQGTRTYFPAIVDYFDDVSESNETDNNFYFSILAGPPPAEDTITVTSPNGGETWYRNAQHTIQWNRTPNPPNITQVEIHLSTDNGASYPHVIASSTSNDGSYSWTISTSIPESTRCRVRVRKQGGGTPSDASDSYFTIEDPPVQLPIKTTNPIPSNGATGVSVNTILAWSNGGGATSYRLYFGTDSTPDSGEFKNEQTGTSYGLGALNYGTHYYWRVDAKNAAGTTPGDVWDFITGCSGPGTPGNVQATDGSYDDHISVTWTGVSGTGIEYRVFRDGIAIGSWQSGTIYDDYAATTVCPATHSYTVKARNSCAEGTLSGSNTGCLLFSCPMPNAPINIRASDSVYEDKVLVQWDPVSGTGIQYLVYRDGSAISGWTSSTSYEDFNATAVCPSNHSYEVKARNACGSESLLSSPNTGCTAATSTIPKMWQTTLLYQYVAGVWQSTGGDDVYLGQFEYSTSVDDANNTMSLSIENPTRLFRLLKVFGKYPDGRLEVFVDSEFPLNLMADFPAFLDSVEKAMLEPNIIAPNNSIDGTDAPALNNIPLEDGLQIFIFLDTSGFAGAERLKIEALVALNEGRIQEAGEKLGRSLAAAKVSTANTVNLVPDFVTGVLAIAKAKEVSHVLLTSAGIVNSWASYFWDFVLNNGSNDIGLLKATTKSAEVWVDDGGGATLLSTIAFTPELWKKGFDWVGAIFLIPTIADAIERLGDQLSVPGRESILLEIKRVSPSLEITQVPSFPPLDVGDQWLFTVTVRNNGTEPLEDVFPDFTISGLRGEWTYIRNTEKSGVVEYIGTGDSTTWWDIWLDCESIGYSGAIVDVLDPGCYAQFSFTYTFDEAKNVLLWPSNPFQYVPGQYHWEMAVTYRVDPEEGNRKSELYTGDIVLRFPAGTSPTMPVDFALIETLTTETGQSNLFAWGQAPENDIADYDIAEYRVYERAPGTSDWSYLLSVDGESSNVTLDQPTATTEYAVAAYAPGRGESAKATVVYNIDTPVLSVTPRDRPVSASVGSTTFSVSNTGGGTMGWNASVVSGGSWLTITSGASGTNAGTITASSSENTGTGPRTGTIRVTAAGATGSPKDVTVTQVGTVATVATPSISPSSGTYLSPISVSMSTITSGATIHYTTNGATPTQSSSAYTGPVSVSGTPGTSVVVIARAFRSGWIPSNVASRIYTYSSTPLPTISVNTTTLSQMVTEGQDTSSQTFSVSNVGGGTLSYTISADVPWISVSPTSGTATTETDNISVIYSTSSLSTGTHSGTITVSDPNATNSPRTISVLLDVREAIFGPRMDFPTGSSPSFVTLGDLDGNGTLDAVATNTASDTISVLLGAGDGTLAAATDYATGGGPFAIALGDLDGNGTLDAVVANVNQDSISVLLGGGDGTFGAKTDYAAGWSPRSVALGDLDGNGTLDAVVMNHFGSTISVFLGFGDGTFGAGGGYFIGYNPESVTLGDLDGDGTLDAVVANNTFSGRVSVLLGAGDGTFGAKTNYSTGEYALSVTLGDVDGNGTLDAVVTNTVLLSGSNTMSVLLGLGDGTFAAGTDYDIAGLPEVVVLGDLDNNGTLDAVVVMGTSISVLLGAGDGTFGAKTDYATVPLSSSIVLGDLDGNGTLDAVVAGRVISVFLSLVMPPLVILGDPNGDGQINSTDALWIIQSEFGLRPPLPLDKCDMNCDGVCNSTDALWIIQIEFGLRTQPSPCP